MDADSQQRPQRKRRSKRWFIAVLLLINLTVAGYFLAPQTVGNQIRRQLQAKLQAHYTHLSVRINGGRVSKDGLVVLEGIEFWTLETGDRAPSRPIVKIGTLNVHTDVQIEKLMAGSMPVCPTRIVAQDVVADIWQDATGAWSPQQLWPPLVMNGGCPLVEIQGGRIRLHRTADNASRPLELDHIQATFGLRHPQAVSPDSPPRPSSLTSLGGEFTILASAAFVDSVRVHGELNQGKLSIDGDATALRIDSGLLSKLPWLTREKYNDIRGVNLTTDVHWTAGGAIASTETAPAQAFVFGVNWAIREGRFEHAKLPQPLENLTGQIAMHPDGIEIQWAQAKFGDADLRLSATTQGWCEDAQISGRLIAAGLMVNERLAKKLPAAMLRAWNDIRPEGPIDLDLQMARKDDQWLSEGTAELRGVDVQMNNFPYPVSQLIGTLQFNNTTVSTTGLSGRIGGQRLSVAFEQMLAKKSGESWLQLAADGPVAIDSPLLASLTPMGQPESRLERFVRSLAPSGSLHLVAARFDRNRDGQTRKSLDLRVTGGSLRYKEFPYPLYDVRGQISVHDGWVQLIGFQASNSDNAKILCDGSFLGMPDDAPHPTDGDWQLALRFRARDLPLDETLRAALAPDSRDLWDQLSPSGVIDQAEVALHHAETWNEPKIVISANQLPRPTIDNRTVSLRAAAIPYRIDVVQGAVRYDGTEVKIQSLDGRHDSTRIAADGRCLRTASGQWRMDLNIHSGSRLHPDAELIGSLPAEVRGAFQRLQLRGPLSARGTVGVLLPDAYHVDPTVQWDINFQLEGNRIGDVGPVRDLRGEITMRGIRDASSVIADGDVRIDSMHIENQQITSIVGPYGIRDDRLYLGESMSQLVGREPASQRLSTSTVKSVVTTQPIAPDPAKSQPIQGDLFGGVVSLSGDVMLADGTFDVIVSITDADVSKMLLEIGQADSDVTGVAQGQIRLEGVVGAGHLLKGDGSASLSQANLYQLPFLISVFNMLRVKPSEAVAFTAGSARFLIYGDQVTFNELKLKGDVIELGGSGTMDRSYEVDLLLDTKMSPQNVWSVVTSPFGERDYTLMTLHVRGPLSNPQIERRAMDAVGGTLERLIPGTSILTNPTPVQSRLDRMRQRLTR